jgi:hypothetical protein
MVPSFLLALQVLLAALLAYIVIRTHERFPEENVTFFMIKFSLPVLFLITMALQALT